MNHTTIAAGTVTIADGVLAFGGDDNSTLAAGAKVTGFGEIDNQVSGSGTIEASGGTLVLVDPVNVGSLQFQIATSATLEMSLGVGSGNTFSFEGRGGSLMIDDPAEFHGTVLGLVDGGSSSTPTNFIQLAGSGISATFNPNSNTLDLSDGGTIQLDPSAAYSPTTRAGTASSDGGTELFLYDPAVCFAEGTRILTDRGEVMVEDLAPGDKVIAVKSGQNEARPVRWIGHRHLDLTRHPRAAFAAPVRIRRGAFSDNQPARDLVVSPDHCLFLDGKLIPAKLLINGMTIVQDRHASSVTYYHVELDRHAVLLAEGVPAETYLDTGNRAFFSNAGLALILHPEFHVNAGLHCWDQDACAPLAVSENAVRPVWRRVAERAETTGFTAPEILTTNEADLHLVAAGRTFRPVSANADRFVFVLPAGIGDVEIVSRANMPAEIKPWLDDRRLLGVAISRIVLRSDADYLDIPVDHPALRSGWHGIETEGRAMWRWTNGQATLPIVRTDRPVTIEIHVRQLGTYVLAKTGAAIRLAA